MLLTSNNILEINMSGKGTKFFESLLGPKLLEGDKEVDIKSVVDGKDYVAIYHSAHWCPPCRRFTPAFIKAYEEIQKKGGKSLATVFVTCDKSEGQFKEYFKDMPWHAVPFSAGEYKGFGGKSAKHLKVNGIPSLSIFDGEGKLIESQGVGVVSENGADFLKMLDPEEKKKAESAAMESLFAAMDLNGDGYIEKSEIEKCFGLIGAPPHITQQEVQTLLTRDTDGDGKLNKKEFCVATYSVAGRSPKWLAEAVGERLKEAKKKEEAKKEFASLKGMDFFKALLGDKLLGKPDKELSTETALDGKEYVGVYLSAHWCPPCKRFTPKLAEAFAMIESKDAKKLAMVFVTCDRDEGSFKGYWGSMPWNAVPFSAKDYTGFNSKAGMFLGVEGFQLCTCMDM
mmetsp:Transcript_6847/g.10821  ORF Transcript_6847/g.10821 Transcript_6847/m.10821 type:complete len:398 (-) Transcript_6847:525-1718(-)